MPILIPRLIPFSKFWYSNSLPHVALQLYPEIMIPDLIFSFWIKFFFLSTLVNLCFKFQFQISLPNYQFQIPMVNSNSKLHFQIPLLKSNSQFCFKNTLPNSHSKFEFQPPITKCNSQIHLHSSSQFPICFPIPVSDPIILFHMSHFNSLLKLWFHIQITTD